MTKTKQNLLPKKPWKPPKIVIYQVFTPFKYQYYHKP
jgi:hypothetical protein